MNGKLTHYFSCTSASDMFYEELIKSVKHYKETEGGRSQVCKAMEDRIDRERAEEKRSAALRMLQAGKYTLEEIADIAGITLEEVKKLRNTL